MGKHPLHITCELQNSNVLKAVSPDDASVQLK